MENIELRIDEILGRIIGVKQLAKIDFDNLNKDDDVSINYMEGYFDAIKDVYNHFNNIKED